MHLFSGTHCPFHRRPLLSLKSAFHTPAPLSIHPLLRRSSQDTLTLYCAPHTALSRRSHPNPRRHPAFPLRLFSAGLPHPRHSLPIPHQPAPSLPSPLSRCTVLPSLQVALLHPRENQFSPPALLVSSARASQWPPTFKLAKSLAEAPGKGGQRQPALPGASCASRLPAWAPRGAQPSPHRPTAAQTYLRVARRGLR